MSKRLCRSKKERKRERGKQKKREKWRKKREEEIYYWGKKYERNMDERVRVSER